MYILVTYDVNTETNEGKRRLYRVAKLCQNYGIRVQNSVFECVITEVQLTQLKDALLATMDRQLDNILIYTLNKNENRRIITLVSSHSLNVEDVLII